MAAFLLAVALPAGLAPGQSGRGRSDEKRQRPVKPVPPTPLPAPPGGPQAPKAETIRINSDLVTVIVSVSGGAGALGESDFEVLEDGVPQTISNFARDEQVPLRLIMLFDTSMSVAQRLGFERRAAARFLERVMRPQDRAALFAFATEVAVLQDFTNQVPLLVNAMRQLHARGATSLYDAIYLASDYVRAAPGRHVVIIVSDGGDTTSAKPLREALAAAQQADAMIFAVFTGYQASQNLRDLAAERALGTLTGETGGEVYYPRVTPGLHGEEIDEQSLNELDAAFARLAEQLRTQYTLGYYSTNDARDGGFRKLAVRVKQPGYATRARAGYYAPKG
ncbi:MAG TPA: VWA domain-containing protein [Blastocatellia bacterium]|nr:VWA domain-containing protein [Blastocatellia bacterium]